MSTGEVDEEERKQNIAQKWYDDKLERNVSWIIMNETTNMSKNGFQKVLQEK